MRLMIKDDVSIVLAGEAGQGLQSIEAILIKVLKKNGYNVFSTKEYMSRVRGGINSTEIRVSSERVASFVERIDILIVLNQDGINHLKNRISENTLVIGEKEKINYSRITDIPLTKIAIDVGNAIYSNSVAAGLICGLFDTDLEIAKNVISQYFSGKSAEIRDYNYLALEKGFNLAKTMFKGIIDINIQKNQDITGETIMSASEAIALGALAGGCSYACGYPMTPSTGILANLAAYSKSVDLIVEQVEDEIGVINMALGAWYAGARAIAATAGGGFALMGEGVSLCGMIESPLVVSVGQRPAPATGLPTRTEQGDLNLILYAGHGTFPRIIFAPGDIKEAFYLTQKAFNLAEKYQVPVFILSDQYLVDCYYNNPEFETGQLKIEKSIIKTETGYKRFLFSENGLSSRGIPGYGEGLVCIDSDEHDEEGRITEDFEVRKRMVDKRMSKISLIKNEIIEPSFFGNDNFRTLIISWGSNLNTILEAMKVLKADDIAFLHYSQLYPFPENSGKILKKAKKLILIENNVNAQFGQLVLVSTGIEIPDRILKYDGMPFSVEEIVEKISQII